MNSLFVLISRFNLKFPWLSNSSQLDPSSDLHPWLESRIQIFKEFCLPSVQSQLDQDFQWIVMFDKRRSPSFLTERVEEWKKWSNLFPFFIEEDFKPQHVSQAVASLLSSQKRTSFPLLLSTARLDTDDILGTHYVKFAKDFATPTVDAFCFPTGYRMLLTALRECGPPAQGAAGFETPQSGYRKTFQHKISSMQARVTLLKSASSPPETVYQYPHNKIKDHFEVHDLLLGQRHFIKIVHEGAVINSPSGWFPESGD